MYEKIFSTNRICYLQSFYNFASMDCKRNFLLNTDTHSVYMKSVVFEPSSINPVITSNVYIVCEDTIKV